MDTPDREPRHEGEMADMLWKVCQYLVPGNLKDAIEDICPGLYTWYKEHIKFLARPEITVKLSDPKIISKQAVEVLNRKFRKYPYK